ncbi:MAG: hypothetical protein QNK37_03570 [Acidobacteriota bacterium]|nr:hypothetical protein [Acidobacteriota bacterium]
MSTAPVRNDFQREKVMETILQTLESKRDINDLIRGSTRRKLRKLHPDFRRTWRVVTAATAARQNLVQTRDKLVSELDMFVRHFRNSLSWRTERLKHGNMIMRFYLPTGDIRPNLTVPRDVVKLAEFLVEGEEIATSQGYPPMSNPSAAELSALIPAAKSAVLAVETADLNHMEAQEDLRIYRSEADTLLRTIAKEIQIELSDKPDSYVRRILRRLGYKFTTPDTAKEEAEKPQETKEKEPEITSNVPIPTPAESKQTTIPKEAPPPIDKTDNPIIRGRPPERNCKHPPKRSEDADLFGVTDRPADTDEGGRYLSKVPKTPEPNEFLKLSN